MLRRNGPVVKSVESVLRLEGSLWGERFVEEVGVIHTRKTAAENVVLVASGKPAGSPVSPSDHIRDCLKLSSQK